MISGGDDPHDYGGGRPPRPPADRDRPPPGPQDRHEAAAGFLTWLAFAFLRFFQASTALVVGVAGFLAFTFASANPAAGVVTIAGLLIFFGLVLIEWALRPAFGFQRRRRR